MPTGGAKPDKELVRFIDELAGSDQIRVDEDLGCGFVRLRASEADRRQAQQDIRGCEDVVLELLRNSRDAGARIICVATRRDAEKREFVVIDDGCGIPASMWDKVFEPRVTSRLDSFHEDLWGVHGRGMALFSIASSTVEHRVVASEDGRGSAIRVVADTTKLSEKTDQSSLPQYAIDVNGRRVMRGPRNINRIVAEFAIAQRSSCLVYLGTPSQVLATLVAYGNRALSRVERAFAADWREYALCLWPAFASTPEEFVEIAARLGMEISARSARRILDGETAPLAPFLDSLSPQAPSVSQKSGSSAARASRRKLRFADDDLHAFSADVTKAFGSLASSYYLSDKVEPQLRVGRDGLHVFIPFAEEEGDVS